MSQAETGAGSRQPATLEPTDEALLDQAARGESIAIGQLYDRYQGIMYGLASRITRDPALAQDVVQDAFVGIWRNAARYSSSRATPRTWILSITHHRAVDAVRRRRPTNELPDAEVTPAGLVLPDIWPEVAGRLDAAAVRTALDGLSPVQREAIELAYFSGLTQQEIAEKTTTPLGTVKSRVRLGLLQLRRSLEPDGNRDAGGTGTGAGTSDGEGFGSLGRARGDA
jgi:RNA polymerase sigma-70 factor (ECF subfamily)